MILPNEKISIGWIDSGMVHGAFMKSVLEIISYASVTNNKINRVYRSGGFFVSKNRDSLVKNFLKDDDSDWLLWIDSDIIVDPIHFKMLCENADSKHYKVLSGIYFISMENDENGLFNKPVPSIFTDKDFSISSNQLIEILYSGLGLTMVHKSVFKDIVAKFGQDVSIHEISGSGENFMGEDVSFFKKVHDIGVVPYAHTSIIPSHIKMVPVGLKQYLNNSV